jgi:nitrate reductase alpha subunit
MPMHMTDTLFHKAKVAQSFIFGGEADNHAVNTVPKETLVRITKAEDGAWAEALSGMSPAAENEFMKRYLSGSVARIKEG